MKQPLNKSVPYQCKQISQILCCPDWGPVGMHHGSHLTTSLISFSHKPGNRGGPNASLRFVLVYSHGMESQNYRSKIQNLRNMLVSGQAYFSIIRIRGMALERSREAQAYTSMREHYTTNCEMLWLSRTCATRGHL